MQREARNSTNWESREANICSDPVPFVWHALVWGALVMENDHTPYTYFVTDLADLGNCRRRFVNCSFTRLHPIIPDSDKQH